MVCYVVPLACFLLLAAWRKLSGSKSVGMFWLNMMFLGASAFGTIDHLWNAELFMLGTNWVSDIALGISISAGITAIWGIMVISRKLHYTAISKNIGIVERK